MYHTHHGRDVHIGSFGGWDGGESGEGGEAVLTVLNHFTSVLLSVHAERFSVSRMRDFKTPFCKSYFASKKEEKRKENSNFSTEEEKNYKLHD